MSVVEFLKNVGAITLPDDVIKKAYRSKHKVAGRLRLSRHDNGNVLLTFAPLQGVGNSRPLLAKDLGQAESDLVSTFGLTPAKARAQVQTLQQTGETNIAVSVEEGLASELFLSRE